MCRTKWSKKIRRQQLSFGKCNLLAFTVHIYIYFFNFLQLKNDIKTIFVREKEICVYASFLSKRKMKHNLIKKTKKVSDV